jgi:hypothetical protein
MVGVRTNTGENLRREWKIPAQQVRYHKDGKWFMPLEQFPGAFCDPSGYVVFESYSSYSGSPGLEIGKRVNVPRGITSLPNYVRVRARP